MPLILQGLQLTRCATHTLTDTLSYTCDATDSRNARKLLK